VLHLFQQGGIIPGGAIVDGGYVVQNSSPLLIKQYPSAYRLVLEFD
jgi:hypothetical protein